MKKTFVSDLLAGLTVSFAALSLGAAFGIMSGRGAFAGMLAAGIIPIITSLFGGTRLQASGPTAPMTAVTAVIVAYAYESFPGDKAMAEQFITLVLLMSSLFLIIAGVVRLGRFIQQVPQVVVLGFMNGIAVLIWVDQIKKLFGWGGKEPIPGGVLTNGVLAFGVLAVIYLLPVLFKWMGIKPGARKFMPPILVTIILFTIETDVTHLNVGHVTLGNAIGSFGEFWNVLVSYFPTDSRLFSPEILWAATVPALQLCLLGYLDSLLTSLVIDKMGGEKTKHDKELVAQGMANGITGLLQGIPGAQATIRSVLLLKEGAQTRLAGVFVGIFVMGGLLVFGTLITHIASAVFVGVLLKAGLDVLDRDFPLAWLKYKWAGNRARNIQFAFILYTTVMTVLVDLNVAVVSGTVLFILGRKFMGFTDAEEDFAVVHENESMKADL